MTAERADRFDGIVVGSGPNGLVCAAYLARAGLRVAVVERHNVPGGGCSTEEVTLPGFRHNLHSNFHAIGAGPVTRDLELERYGLRYMYPEVQHAFVFRDDTAITLHADAPRTAGSIARFSTTDAERYLELQDRFGREMAPLLRGLQFSPPLNDDELVERLDGPLGAEYQAYREMSLYEAVDRNFEHDRVRTVWKLHLHASAYEDGPGLGHVFLRIVARSGWSGLAVGGSASLARALIAAIEAHGGRVIAGNGVARIEVEGGRATGVVLDDGARLHAERFVASSADPPQTLELTGDRWFGPKLAEGLRDYRWAAWSLATLHLALSEPPAYRAAAYDPDVDRAFGVYIGADSSVELERNFAAIERGELPDAFCGNGAANSRFDPSQAPPGGHTAFWWPFAPYDLHGSAATWDDERDTVAARILDEWSAYAPNLRSAVLGSFLFTPLDIERRCCNMVRGSHHGGAYGGGQIDAGRPVPGMSSYRTPVDGLYLCGASSHPGGSIHGAPGYNAANVIAGDLGLERWWTPVAIPASSG
jgi:phytoene dehydrogenase-like protein